MKRADKTCRAAICPWFHVAKREPRGNCRACGGRPQPRPRPAELIAVKPGSRFRLRSDTKGRQGWIFEAGDCLCGREHNAFLVSGGEYPGEAPGDEYWFRKTRLVIPIPQGDADA